MKKKLKELTEIISPKSLYDDVHDNTESEVSLPLENQTTIDDIFTELNKKSEIESVENILSPTEQAKQLLEAETKVKKQKSTKKKILNFIFILLNILVVAFIIINQLEKDGIAPPDELKINIWWLLGTFGLFFLMMFSEQIRITTLIYKSTKKFRPWLGYKTAVNGRYYDAITPLGTGGQPFQVFYLKNRGIKASTAISIPLAKYIFQQMIFVVFATVVLFSNLGTSGIVGTGNVAQSVVGTVSWICWGVNILLIGTILFLSISKKTGKKIVGGFLKFLAKIKVLKNYDKQFSRVMKTVIEYQNTMKFFTKSKLALVVNLLFSIGMYLVFYSVPFFIVCALGEYNPEIWVQLLVLGIMVDLATSMIPIPGATGVAEVSFTALFASLFTGGYLFWALIIWRVVTYYGFILQGILMMFYDFIIGNKKNEKYLAKLELEQANKIAQESNDNKLINVEPNQNIVE